MVCGLCGVQSSSDMSGISTLLLPAPLLNNILNFKVIFQPLLITSPSQQGRIDRNQGRVFLVLMVKMKSIMFASSQPQFAPHRVWMSLCSAGQNTNINYCSSSLLTQNIEWRVVVLDTG